MAPIEQLGQLQTDLSELATALTKCVETGASDTDKGIMLGTLAQQLPEISGKMLLYILKIKNASADPAY